MSKCDCNDCVPCEMHGFCHLCETERLNLELDLEKAKNKALKIKLKIAKRDMDEELHEMKKRALAAETQLDAWRKATYA